MEPRQHRKIETAEQEAQFTKGINLMFQTWSAIDLILENESAGEDTDVMIEELEENLCTWLLADGDELAASEIEVYINEVFSEDMNVDVQDGSVKEVSQNLLSFYKECAMGDFSRIQQWELQLQKPKLKKSEMLPVYSSDEEDEEEEGHDHQHFNNSEHHHHHHNQHEHQEEHHHPHAPPLHHHDTTVQTNESTVQRDAEGWVTVQNSTSNRNNNNNTSSRNRRNQNRLESAQKYLLEEEDKDEEM